MAEARWLEVSLTVDGELAEAVSEVLNRFVSQGVVVEQAVRYNDAEDVGTPYGPVRVFGYLPIDEQVEDTRQRLEEALYYLGRIQPLPKPEFRDIADENWMESWKQHYHPIPIGKKLLILPAWIEEYDRERIPVRIDPSMAFGTGTHPTTQLCMEMVEKYTLPGKPIIDVGCGSGILSIAALKLGASRAVGVDIDSASVKATYENGAANDVEDRLEVGVGSVRELRQGHFSIRHAPVVVANILAPVIIRLFDAGLGELPEPGGTLVLSGILAEQAAGVEEKGKEMGLEFVERVQQKDWVAIVMRRP
ncbi:[LSU ribosomal protein L11P]-lysine N-methyltransferase [Longilinea arvoryzae]|uniref:Ribosomal protein L11 methyltransferase n=1 Tax=Longilinea arvoryzae TaxID=360412 RepID=A0A0S7BIC2_9CHLR|nr:50S ribosomal protein L11 methyltransferase [Longilinea arvoryzae]GAP13525.1 [LSU ribosomal protein L11P]-lysine N-methyltransferase [Longilinea arvoryzae]